MFMLKLARALSKHKRPLVVCSIGLYFLLGLVCHLVDTGGLAQYFSAFNYVPLDELRQCTSVADLTQLVSVDRSARTWHQLESAVHSGNALRHDGAGGPITLGERAAGDNDASAADCGERSVAIVVPYRNREEHLRVFLWHMHRFLSRQDIHYRIFVVHQVDKLKFNRAKLLNVGFREALSVPNANFTCFIFHDVDLLPLMAGIPYNCPTEDGPLHMVGAMDKFDWGLLYDGYFGGVTAFTRRQYERMNGMSNCYWGWGGEDDDARTRTVSSGQRLNRLPPELGAYTMAKHEIDASNEPDEQRYERNDAAGRLWRSDGLSSLSYELAADSKKRFGNTNLVTEIVVDLMSTDGCEMPPTRPLWKRVLPIG